MNIRYINMGEISGIELAAEQEILQNIEPSAPMIVAYFTSKPIFTIGGNCSLSKFLYPEEIPVEADLLRINSNIEGAMYVDQNTLVIHIHIKDSDLPNNKTPKEIMLETILDTIIEELQKIGVDIKHSTHREQSNDLVLIQDGKEKKVAATWMSKFREGWTTYGIFINFKPDLDLMEQVFRIDTDKFIFRDVENFRDAVSGIDEEDKINRNTFTRSLVEKITYNLGHTLVDGGFTQEEQSAMDKSKDILLSNDWIQRGIRPIICIKQEPHEFPIESV